MTKERPNKGSLFIYCTLAEKELITKASFKSEKNRSTFCREAILKEANRLIESKL